MSNADPSHQEDRTGGTEQRPSHTISGRALQFDLAQEVRLLKGESAWASGNRNSKTLVLDSSFRVVLTVLKAGARLEEHRASGWTSVQTVSGWLRLVVADGEPVDLAPEGLLVMQPDVPHSVEAVEESTFLLSIALRT
jgi:quercetin dioxygenase-like cupin family protein